MYIIGREFSGISKITYNVIITLFFFRKRSINIYGIILTKKTY